MHAVRYGHEPDAKSSSNQNCPHCRTVPRQKPTAVLLGWIAGIILLRIKLVAVLELQIPDVHLKERPFFRKRHAQKRRTPVGSASTRLGRLLSFLCKDLVFTAEHISKHRAGNRRNRKADHGVDEVHHVTVHEGREGGHGTEHERGSANPH